METNSCRKPLPRKLPLGSKKEGGGGRARNPTGPGTLARKKDRTFGLPVCEWLAGWDPVLRGQEEGFLDGIRLLAVAMAPWKQIRNGMSIPSCGGLFSNDKILRPAAHFNRLGRVRE